MTVSHQTKSLLVVALSSGAFLLVSFRPGTQKLETARAEVRRLNEEISSQSARLASLESIHHEVLELRQRTAPWPQRIPREPSLGDFLSELTAILERTGVENHILQPRPTMRMEPERVPPEAEPEALGIHIQPVLIQCDGAFESIFRSLVEIERMPRLSQVERLKIDAIPDKPGRVHVEMLLNTFFASAPSNPPAELK